MWIELCDFFFLNTCDGYHFNGVMCWAAFCADGFETNEEEKKWAYSVLRERVVLQDNVSLPVIVNQIFWCVCVRAIGGDDDDNDDGVAWRVSKRVRSTWTPLKHHQINHLIHDLSLTNEEKEWSRDDLCVYYVNFQSHLITLPYNV